jgi:hypothetical protein
LQPFSAGLGRKELLMNQGRTIFAQLVELLPRKAFDRAVRRYRGQARFRALSCPDQLLFT